MGRNFVMYHATRISKFVFRIVIKNLTIFSLYPFFWLSHFRVQATDLAPVFIVGAPRTGSTIFYQALTNCYDVKYIDNAASSWYQNLPFGMWLSYLKYGDKPHNNYLAELGNTLKFGGHAPSECGDFWYRWLPQDRHFIDVGEVSGATISVIRKELNSIMSRYARPILFKNLNMGQRLRFIKDTYPDAKIVFIRRDPRFVVRSIQTARKKLDVRADEWWSVRPKNYKKLIGLPELDLCAAQVYHIEEQIKGDLELFDSKNVVTVHFNELNENKIDDIANSLGLNRKPNTTMPELSKDVVNSLSKDELATIGSSTQKFAFDEELFV